MVSTKIGNCFQHW